MSPETEVVTEMRKYILNSAVITRPGFYEYRIITLDHARAWLQAGLWESTIGYQETATALTALTGIDIPCNRKLVLMDAGDEALIFRLTCRMQDPALKGKLTPAFVLQNCELGLLKALGEGKA